jgi:hypothetical protein
MTTGIDRLRAIVDDMIDVSMIDNNLLKLNFPAHAGRSNARGAVTSKWRKSSKTKACNGDQDFRRE